MSFASSVIIPFIRGLFPQKGDVSGKYTQEMFESFHREDNAEDNFVHDKCLKYAGNRELDIYYPDEGAPRRGTIIYACGGGFIADFHKYYSTRRFAWKMARDGFVTVVPRYRLGLRDFSKQSKLKFGSALSNAVCLAAEDTMLVTRFLLDRAEELEVDKDKIILLGSSSGAFPCLQCDMERSRGSEMARILPEGFSYAAIISLCGAVFSAGRPRYGKGMPSPTLFIHGTRDDMVPYKRCTLFGYGLYGPYSIVREFRRKKAPYRFMHFVDQGHSVAARYMNVYENILRFIDQAVNKKDLSETDEYICEPLRKPIFLDYANPIVLYKSVLSQLKLKPIVD